MDIYAWVWACVALGWVPHHDLAGITGCCFAHNMTTIWDFTRCVVLPPPLRQMERTQELVDVKEADERAAASNDI
jgi:hypothetical protein